MTATVTIAEGEHSQQLGYIATDSAQEAVRFKFNPSALERVTRVKALSSLLVAEIDSLRSSAMEKGVPPGNEMSAVEILLEARKLAVSASMWAVLGATKGL
jgi:uncharacterized protein YunC (DUF1805 family)